jgi:hypothetical protein
MASEIRRVALKPFSEGKPVPGDAEGKELASAAVAPMKSELRSIVRTGPVIVWICPSARYQVGPMKRLGSQRARARWRSASDSQTRCRAVAMSRSRAPASRSAVARSIGWIVWPGCRGAFMAVGDEGGSGARGEGFGSMFPEAGRGKGSAPRSERNDWAPAVLVGLARSNATNTQRSDRIDTAN